VPAVPPSPNLNAAQLEVLERLGRDPDNPRQFDAGLRHELLAELESGLAPLVDALPEGTNLFLSKYPLSGVHGCEQRFLVERDAPFAWTPAMARGIVAHKAVELSVHWRGTPLPLELVDEAVASLIEGDKAVSDWLRTCTPTQLAELRAEANERVATFLECFPPLKAAWRPVTESSVRVELFDQRIVLSGRVDLTLGQPDGTTAGKVLIDLKSGGFSPSHVEDLRFYALLETVKLGTPPLRLATYYLDMGRPHPEDVDEDVLAVAIRRTIDGARRIVELAHHAHAPVLRPAPWCRWCPELAACPTGRAWVDDHDSER
jgi:hypothetical protein